MTVIEEISFHIRNTNSKKEKDRRNEKSEMPMHSTCDLLQAPVHVSRSYTSNLPNCDTAMFSKERLSAVFHACIQLYYFKEPASLFLHCSRRYGSSRYNEVSHNECI